MYTYGSFLEAFWEKILKNKKRRIPVAQNI
jgi:hypothetical protein